MGHRQRQPVDLRLEPADERGGRVAILDGEARDERVVCQFGMMRDPHAHEYEDRPIRDCGTGRIARNPSVVPFVVVDDTPKEASVNKQPSRMGSTALGALAVLGLVAASCGDDDDGGTADTERH